MNYKSDYEFLFFVGPEEFMGCHTDIELDQDSTVQFSNRVQALDQNSCNSHCFELSMSYGVLSNGICLCGDSGTCANMVCSSLSVRDIVTCSSKPCIYISGTFKVTAEISLSSDTIFYAGTLSTFTVAVSISNIQTFIWNFGDGQEITQTTMSPATITHNYVLPGLYTLTLKVCTSTGICQTASVSVKVKASDLSVTPTLSCQNYTKVSTALSATARFIQGYEEEYLWSRQWDSSGTLFTGKLDIVCYRYFIAY